VNVCVSGDVTLRFSADANTTLDLNADKIIRDGALKVALDTKGQGKNSRCESTAWKQLPCNEI
jgi:hypothetical protein